MSKPKTASIIELEANVSDIKIFDTGLTFNGQKLFLQATGTRRDMHLKEQMQNCYRQYFWERGIDCHF